MCSKQSQRDQPASMLARADPLAGRVRSSGLEFLSVYFVGLFAAIFSMYLAWLLSYLVFGLIISFSH